MPKALDFDKEIETSQKILKDNPDHRFPIAAKVHGNDYVLLLKDCRNSGLPLTRMIEQIVKNRYAHPERPPTSGVDDTLPDFDPIAAEIVNALSVLWKCEPTAVVRKLVEHVATTEFLKKEIQRHDDFTKQMNSLRPKATVGA